MFSRAHFSPPIVAPSGFQKVGGEINLIRQTQFIWQTNFRIVNHRAIKAIIITFAIRTSELVKIKAETVTFVSRFRFMRIRQSLRCWIDCMSAILCKRAYCHTAVCSIKSNYTYVRQTSTSTNDVCSTRRSYAIEWHADLFRRLCYFHAMHNRSFLLFKYFILG